MSRYLLDVLSRQGIELQTLDDIQQNISSIAPNFSAFFEDGTLVVSKSNRREFRIKDAGNGEFNISTRENNSAKMDQIGGGQPVSFKLAVNELGNFLWSEAEVDKGA